MKLREIPRAQLGLLIAALATQPNDDNSRIALARKRDAYLKDAGLADDEKGVFLSALQAAESAPVTADATAALAKFGELKDEGEEDATPTPAATQAIPEDALAAARQELNPGHPVQDLNLPHRQQEGEKPEGEGITNPVLQEDVQVPTEDAPQGDEQPVKRGPGRPRKDA